MDEMTETQKDYNAAEQFRDEHPECLECDDRCCPLNGDGTPKDCNCGDSCDGEFAEPVYDDVGGLTGYVHRKCRDHYIMLGLQREIEEAFKVRRPLGLDPWIIERSRNLAQRLFFSFKIDLLDKKGQ